MAPIAMILAMCTLPGQSVGFAAFNRSIREELQLSASQFGGAYALGTILASLLLPLTGYTLDRIGIRRTTLIIIPALCGACFFISSVHGLFSLFAAFLMLRFLGQGALSLCSQNTLAMWFEKRLGRVHGITSTLVTLFMASSPLAIRGLIQQFGWRSTYQGLGVAVVLIVIPLLWFFRNRPEDVGQSPDGFDFVDLESGDKNSAHEARSDSRQERTEPIIEGLSLSAALRMPSYWILIGLNVVWSMVGTSLIFDVQALGQTMVGSDLAKTAWGDVPVDAANTSFFVAVGVMNLVGGFLADRYSLLRLLRLALLGMVIGLLTLQFGFSGWGGLAFFAAYAIYGLAQGLLSAVSSTIWPRFFGRAHLGKIRGGAMMAMVAGSSLGPLLMGLAFDNTGAFSLPLRIYTLLTIVGWLGAAFLKPPEKRDGNPSLG